MAITTPQKVQAIKAKPSEKKGTKKNLLEQLHVVRMWEAHASGIETLYKTTTRHHRSPTSRKPMVYHDSLSGDM